MEKGYLAGHGKLAIADVKVTDFRADALVLPANHGMRRTLTGIHKVLEDRFGQGIFGMPDFPGFRNYVDPCEAAFADPCRESPYRFMIHSYGAGEDGSCGKEVVERALANVFALIRERTAGATRYSEIHGRDLPMPKVDVSTLAIPLLDKTLFIDSPSYNTGVPFALAGMIHASEQELKRSDTPLERITILVPHRGVYAAATSHLDRRFAPASDVKPYVTSSFIFPR